MNQHQPAVSYQARSILTDAIVIDGLVVKFGGWTEDLAQGGLTAVHVTVDTFTSGFCETVARVVDHLHMVESDRRLRQVRSAADIEACKREGKVGLIFGFQNAKPIEDDLRYLRVYYELGVRVIQLTYNERNFVGDGCLEPGNGGLSLFGRAVIREMNRLGILVDLSHCGERTTLEAIDHSEQPVAFTHANARALTPNPRNKTDHELRALAARGGVIGLSCYGPFCWKPERGVRPTVEDFVDHIDYVANLVGIDHVGIGSDWTQGLSEAAAAASMAALTKYDRLIGEYSRVVGAGREVRRPGGLESPAGMSLIAETLVRRRYAEEDIRKILGGNFLRLFRQTWGG